MIISSNFNDNERGITLEPENDLESALLMDMLKRAEKGATVKLTSIEHSPLCVVIKVNGK